MNNAKRAEDTSQSTAGHETNHGYDGLSAPKNKLTRRKLLSKAFYIAPTLTVFGTIRSLPVGAASLGITPPPPPETPSALVELEHSLLQQEQFPAGPDPLELFSGDPEN